MDESQVRPGLPGDRSQAAAEKLRALRERANEALQGHQSRLGEIETQLSDRVRQLAEEYGASLGAAIPAAAETPTADEIAALRRQVEEGEAKHQKFVEQLGAARKQLDEIQSRPCASCQQAAQQLATAEGEVQRLRDELETASREHREDRERHEKFVEQLTAARQAITVLQHAAGETSSELRNELEEANAAKAAAEAQLAAAQRDLAALHGQCEAESVRVAVLEREAAESQSESASLAAELSALQRELAAAQAETATAQAAAATANAEALAATDQAAAAERELAEVREGAEALRKEVTLLSERAVTLSHQAATLDRDRGATASQFEQLRQESEQLAAKLVESEREAQALRQQIDTATFQQQLLNEALAREQAAAKEELDSRTELLNAADGEVQLLREALAASDQDKLQLTLSLSQAEAACREYQRRQGHLETETYALRDQAAAAAEAPQLRAQLEDARTAAAEQARAMTAAQATIDQSRQELAALREATVPQAELTAVRQDYDAAQAKIAELEAAAAHAASEVAAAHAETVALLVELPTVAAHADLRQKCDLALADLQKLKRENSTLREELAERPETSDQESPDLIAVRSERDALAARVAELEAEAEAAAASQVDAGVDQSREDLQRRFEMAVDDVRQLKQENARLRDKVAASEKSGHAAPAAHGGGGDWASQRARLVALLEEEDETSSKAADRVAERASIQSTIAATNQAIAAKDEELAELRAALEAQCGADASDATAAAHDKIFDADAVIAAERERLAALTTELDAKLRAAELEFSVERAKLARDQAALREQMFELKSNPPAPGVPGEVIDNSKPRRRWLSALGLGEEDEPKKR